MCLILTPIVYLWVQEIHLLLLVFAVYGFFIQGVFSWTPQRDVPVQTLQNAADVVWTVALKPAARLRWPILTILRAMEDCNDRNPSIASSISYTMTYGKPTTTPS